MSDNTQTVAEQLKAFEGQLLGLIPVDRIKAVNFPRPAPDIIERYKRLPDLTSSIADILDQFGVDSAIPTTLLAPLAPGQRMVGPAVTVKHGPARFNAGHNVANKTSPQLGAVDEVTLSRAGDVMVIDGSAVPTASNIGGIMATAVAAKGFAGVVVDGCVRDVENMKRMGLPVWARGATPRTGKHRMELVEFNGKVDVAGVQVLPGDLVLGDSDGVIIVPYDLCKEVLLRAEQVAEKEKVLLGAIESGASAKESASIISPDKW
ncbi:RraA family protein [Shinella oryzae]|uniref:RraA family protein n=1 Tax=Shinella oryzae TaxID=2871820 RepID=UPI001FF55EBD|nr:RraA family protein [Shinella oryzae]UPA27917.1 RraA family protein [Shinella oryzae]